MIAILLIKKHRWFLLLLLLAIVIRLLVINIPPFKIDMDAWIAWSYRLFDLGLSQFYAKDVWTNYTPGYLYILWLLGIINVIFSLEQSGLVTLIKLISICFELSLAILVYQKYQNLLSKRSMIFLQIALLFNPATIFNSTIWGQIDGILTYFLLLSVLYLSEKRLEKSSLSYAYSFLVKPQSVALAPLYLIDVFKNFSLKNIRQLIIPGTLLFIFLSLPFFFNDPLFCIFRLIFQMSQDYPATSLFAYNFWGTFGFWISDLQTVGPLSYRMIGTLLYLSAIIGILFLGIKKKAPNLALASLLFLAFYFLPTRVHERYLYPAIPFLFIYASVIKNKFLIILTILLSLLYFCSLYYVYVYYNEFYLNLGHTLYQQTFYNMIETNGKLLSFISSTIFIMIVWQIIQAIYDKKNHSI